MSKKDKKNKQNEKEIKPGDALLLSMPKTQPGKPVFCSVRVLDRESSSDNTFVGQILESISSDFSKETYLSGRTMEFNKNSVVSIHPASLNGIDSFITIEISNGYISSIYRTDGKTNSVNVRVIDLDCNSDQIFKVDAVSAPLITKRIDENEIQEMFLIEEGLE